jgi:gamma-glutamyltranspeptidase / glutathione hydrolase
MAARLLAHGAMTAVFVLAAIGVSHAQTAPTHSPQSSSQAQTQTQAQILGSGPPIFSTAARIHPERARHGMVVAQEAKAAIIGRDILRKGGNAVDAAVATGFALAVTLPRAGNIGGGGFMLVHLAKTKKTIAIDYRETAPDATKPNVFLDASGEFVRRKSQASGLAVGVPGTVAGLALAHAKYGSGTFTLAQLIAPAIKLAREGVVVNQDLADSLPWAVRRFRNYPASRAIFMRPDGRALQEGDLLLQRDLAASLERIARLGPKGFYTGPTAQAIVAAVASQGGALTPADLATYEAKERPIVQGKYRGHTIISMPPPSSGGVHIIQMLNILEAYPLRDYGHNSAASIHVMVEAMKRAYADRSKYLGDPDFVAVPVKALISRAYGTSLQKQISLQRATPARDIKPGNPLPYESDQTTHYSTADADGNAVSNTYTLNFTYGLGMVAPGTGILLNNELDDFAARPDAPNAYGLLGGKANAPGPRKRPLSSMSPLMVFGKDGGLEIVTGTPGGSRIITAVLQIVLNIVDYGMNAAEATIAPRVHHQWYPDRLQIERGISKDTQDLLKAKGHTLDTRRTIGSTQTIVRKNGMLYGASDTRRRGGAAVGY